MLRVIAGYKTRPIPEFQKEKARDVLFSRRQGNNIANKLFRLNIHVGRGTNTDMPADRGGAYVPVFVGAEDREPPHGELCLI